MLALGALLAASAIRGMIPPSPAAKARTVSVEAATMLSLGRHTAMATATWARTADLFASGDVDPERIAASIRTIGALDPTWVEPWFFGILMLPESSADLRLELLDEAAVLHPDVPWFAWRAGMARYGEDRDVALEWLRRAAEAPGADPAYAELLQAMEDPS